MTSLTNEEIFAEFYYTAKAIRQVLGYTPRCWRPPYGDIDDRVRTWAYAMGLESILWDQDTNDCASATANRSDATRVARIRLDRGSDPEELREHPRQRQHDARHARCSDASSGMSDSAVLEHELGLQIADMFTSNFAKIKSTYTHIVSPHICNKCGSSLPNYTNARSRTQPYVEADAPTLPTFAEWLAGAAPAGNFTAGTDPTRTVSFGNLGGQAAVTALPSPSSTTSSRALGPTGAAALNSGLPLNVNGNAASASAASPAVSRVGGAASQWDGAALRLGVAVLLAAVVRLA